MAARIREHDWTATSVGPIEAWPPALRATVDLLLAHGFPMIVLWGPDLIQVYNDGYRALMGGKHPMGLGQPTRACWPEVWHINAPIYEQVRTGETLTFEDKLYPIARNCSTEDAWFTLTYSPVRDGAEGIVGILVTVFETTGRVQATVDLRASEERYRAFVTASSDVVYRMSPDWSRMHRLDGQGFLADTAEPSEGWMERYIHPDDQPMVQAAIEAAILGKGVFELEHPVHRADGTLGWTLSRAVPILDEQGEIAEWLGTASDVTVRERSEEALRESEEHFSQFAASSSDALWIRDAGTLAMEYTSPAIQTIYGISPDAILGDMTRWVALIEPEDRDTAIVHIEQAQVGAAVTHEFRIRRPSDGEVRWIRNTDFPLHDALGRVQRIGGIAEDVTEAKHAAQRQEVLVNELQHRARNLLAVVTAIADRTVKRGGSVEAFEERLQALSRAQGLLSQGGSDTVEVGALVRAELAAYANAASDRVGVAGPVIHLTVRQVQNFALAVHELTTNAVKHGALKGDLGRLAVTWEVVPDRRGRHRLALDWVESGVSIEPNGVTRRGYGTELIQEALAYALQARVDYTLGPDGVRCRIEMPIS